MLGGEDDVAVGGGSNKWGSGFVEHEETGNSREIGRLGDCFRVSINQKKWLLIPKMRVLPE